MKYLKMIVSWPQTKSNEAPKSTPPVMPLIPMKIETKRALDEIHFSLFSVEDKDIRQKLERNLIRCRDAYINQNLTQPEWTKLNSRLGRIDTLIMDGKPEAANFLFERTPVEKTRVAQAKTVKTSLPPSAWDKIDEDVKELEARAKGIKKFETHVIRLRINANELKRDSTLYSSVIDMIKVLQEKIPLKSNTQNDNREKPHGPVR